MDSHCGNLWQEGEEAEAEPRGHGEIDDKALEAEVHCVSLRWCIRAECQFDVWHTARPVEDLASTGRNSYGWKEGLRGWATDN